jgi:hypothetical protein
MVKINTIKLQDALNTSNLEYKKILISAVLKWKLILSLWIIFSILIWGIIDQIPKKYAAEIVFESSKYIEVNVPTKSIKIQPIINHLTFNYLIKSPSTYGELTNQICNNQDKNNNIVSLLNRANLSHTENFTTLRIFGGNLSYLEKCLNAIYSDLKIMQENLSKKKIAQYEEKIKNNKIKINFLIKSYLENNLAVITASEETKILLEINYIYLEAISYINNNQISLIFPITLHEINSEKNKFKNLMPLLLGLIFSFIIATNKEIIEHITRKLK